MKVVGFITEYNPFHLGHKYHLKMAKETTDATHSVAVMSSSFVQRGEPALLDKWTRARMAVDNGVDLVIELPFLYAVQSAEFFAHGAVKIMDSMGIVDNLAFGSESGELNTLRQIAEILVDEPDPYKILLRKYLDTGISFSAARSKAISDYMINSWEDSHSYSKILKQSNNILGIEYIKALIRLNSNISPVLVNRKGNDYNDKKITSEFASATGIRAKISSSGIESIKEFVPEETYRHINDFYNKFEGFNSLDNYAMIFQYLFRLNDSIDLSSLMDIEPGLDNRILDMGRKSNDIENVIKSITSKRYPSTRIKRLLIHMLADLKQEDIRLAYDNPINYIRVLGSNKNGLEMLAKIKNNSPIRIITKYADYQKYKDNTINHILKYEEKATDLYFLGLLRDHPLVNLDYYTTPYIKS